jgi:serine/threonine protein phosphatase PrpC
VQFLGVDVAVTVANAGDCRAVCGIFQATELQTEVLSADHSIAASPSERERLRADFPHHEVIKFDEEAFADDPEEGTVLGLCRFTRALGDGHLKSPAAAEAFNAHHTRKGTGLSVPVIQSGDPPYISCVPECTTARFADGFVILACDGVWDEISNEQAVRTVGKLLCEHGEDPSVNIAELFITQVLKNAAARIADEVEGEAEMTYRELRRRPCGKAPGARSSLHDDITVVILDFEPPDVDAAASGGTASARQQTLAALSPSWSPMSSADSRSSADGSPGSKGPAVISAAAGTPPLYRTDSTDMGVPNRLSPRSGQRKTRPAGVRIRPRSSSDRLEAMMRSSVDGLPQLD